MATKCVLNKSTMTNIANAIRTKGGTSASLLPSAMPAAIDAIQTGGLHPWRNDGKIHIWLEVTLDNCYVRFAPTIVSTNGGSCEWGDGSSTSIAATQNRQVILTHTYAIGSYEIVVDGIDSWTTDTNDVLKSHNAYGNDADNGLCLSVVQAEFNHLTSINTFNTAYRSFDKCYKLKSVKAPDLTYIGRGAFDACVSLSELIMPSSFDGTGIYAFQNAYNFDASDVIPKFSTIAMSAFTNSATRSATIKSGVTNIAQTAFSNCYRLTTVILPEGLTEISTSAFSMCINLTEITIPRTVTSILGSAFDQSKIKTLTMLPTTPPTLGNSNVFRGCFDAAGSKIIVPAGTLNAYKTATNWSSWASKMEEAS